MKWLVTHAISNCWILLQNRNQTVCTMAPYALSLSSPIMPKHLCWGSNYIASPPAPTHTISG